MSLYINPSIFDWFPPGHAIYSLRKDLVSHHAVELRKEPQFQTPPARLKHVQAPVVSPEEPEPVQFLIDIGVLPQRQKRTAERIIHQI